MRRRIKFFIVASQADAHAFFLYIHSHRRGSQAASHLKPLRRDGGQPTNNYIYDWPSERCEERATLDRMDGGNELSRRHAHCPIAKAPASSAIGYHRHALQPYYGCRKWAYITNMRTGRSIELGRRAELAKSVSQYVNKGDVIRATYSDLRGSEIQRRRSFVDFGVSLSREFRSSMGVRRADRDWIRQ